MMKYPWLICPLVLTGCATYNESFDCEPGKGVGCVSLSCVNHMVDERKLPLGTEEETIKPVQIASSQNKLRIWMAEYTDEEGVTHKPSVVYVPLDEKAL